MGRLRKEKHEKIQCAIAKALAFGAMAPIVRDEQAEHAAIVLPDLIAVLDVEGTLKATNDT